MANEFTDIIRRIQNATQPALRIAVNTVMAVQKKRIFEQGLDSNGGKIGSYSTNPISISSKNQARNTGKTYFKGGYSEYKTAVGKNPGYVNLRNTDQMMSDYGVVGSGLQLGFGFQNTENYKKSQWMEEKYEKDIFDISQTEENLLADTLVFELNRLI